MINTIYQELQKPVSILPLAIFRILYGLMMFVGLVRMYAEGWVEKLYIVPTHFFKFYGFEWVKVPNEMGVYLLFLIAAISALGISAGLFYRFFAILFFCTFSYIELMDATNYLNHYYLVAWLALILIFLPAHRFWSLDIKWRKIESASLVSNGYIWTIKVLLVVVYFYAGLAKVNSDWLLNAMPLKIWLPERTSIPVLGYFFQFPIVAYIFSWFGCLYDLSIGFLLCFRRTKWFAYLMVIVFHTLTGMLFNIGMFPIIMIMSTLIFFNEKDYGFLFKKTTLIIQQEKKKTVFLPKIGVLLFTLFIVFHFFVPLRHFLYSSNVLWAEEGYRFSWRVMLVEKIGYARFIIKDGESNRQQEILNQSFLTEFQEKQMSIQPDFILQFAKIITKEYENKHGFRNAKVYVESHVALNGRVSERFIDVAVDLNSINDDFLPKKWVLPIQNY